MAPRLAQALCHGAAFLLVASTLQGCGTSGSTATTSTAPAVVTTVVTTRSTTTTAPQSLGTVRLDRMWVALGYRMELMQGVTATIKVERQLQLLQLEQLRALLARHRAAYNETEAAVLDQLLAANGTTSGTFALQLLQGTGFDLQNRDEAVESTAKTADAKAVVSDFAGLAPQTVLLKAEMVLVGQSPIPWTYDVCVDLLTLAFAGRQSTALYTDSVVQCKVVGSIVQV